MRVVTATHVGCVGVCWKDVGLLYARVFLLLSLACGLCRVSSKNKKINYCKVKIVHIHMSTLKAYSIFIEQMF